MAGAWTRGGGVTSISPDACSVAFATAGLVEVRNTSAASRPSSPPGQPSHAWVTDSTNVSQSRSIRLTAPASPACASGPSHEAAAEEREATDPTRMPRRPGDGRHRRVIEAEQDDLTDAGRRDHGVEVPQVCLQR